METTYGHHIGPVTGALTGDVTGNLNGVKAYKFTAALSPAQVAANTTAEELFTVNGVAVGDVVYVNKPTAQAGLGIVGARVSATNQVGITFSNNTGVAITPTASQTYAFGVLR
jgi:hypothetical protein